MNYDALNIADGELSLGDEFFAKVSSEAKVPLVSANLSGRPGVIPYLLRKVGGLTVAITGVTAGNLLPASQNKLAGVANSSPADVLKKLIPTLRKQADIVILLSHLGYEGTISLLKLNEIEGVDVAVAAHGRNMLTSSEKVGRTLVIQNSMGGEYLGNLKLQISDAGLIEVLGNELIALKSSVPEDPQALEMMTSFHKEENNVLAQEDRLKIMSQIENAKSEEIKNLQSKYLSMSPEQFMEELKKKNGATTDNSAPSSPAANQ